MEDLTAKDSRPRPELVIFIGLQASGKSSFFRSRFSRTHVHVSKDTLRNNKNRNRRQQQLIEAALQQQASVVVDNTNPSVEDRAPLMALGQALQAEGMGYYFESRVSECLERNRQREGKARVPDAAIYSTIKKLVRPSYGEGFDKLFYVRIVNENDFEVLEWIDEEADDGQQRV